MKMLNIQGLCYSILVITVFCISGLSNAMSPTIQLDDLSFKSVIRGLYGEQMSNVYIEDTDIKLPHVGLRIAKKEFLASLHPVIQYQNAQNETRYILMIEKQEVSDSKIVSCHACSSLVDLYIFEKRSDQKYRLVSRSKPSENFRGSWGATELDLSSVIKNIQKVSANTVGGFYEAGYSSTGETEGWLNLLVLNESGYIKSYFIDHISGDNLGNVDENSPLAYSYSAKYQITPDSSTSGLYPVKVVFNGEKYTDDYKKIIKYDVIKTFYFKSMENKYLLGRTTPY